jgi:hypothetical protein
MTTSDQDDAVAQIRKVLHDLRNDVCVVMGGLDALDIPNPSEQTTRALRRANDGVDRVNDRLQTLTAIVKTQLVNR